MHTVLILGAGMVTAPMVDYLSRQPDMRILLADVAPEKAEAIIAGRRNAVAEKLDVTDRDHLKNLVARADIVVSLVPYTYHPLVAGLCIEAGKPMVTASYVSDAMRRLDSAARAKGIILLNEIGLDPGIDHMSAMRIIHGVKEKGGTISSFYSYCGGLPAPDANTNPLGYKFSWSPRGVVLAGRNAAQYRKNNAVVTVENADLFAHTWMLEFEGIGKLEAYPNRDSLPYLDLYGLGDAASLYRGTLRYPGWCDSWLLISRSGLLDLKERSDLDGRTFNSLVADVTGLPPGPELKSAFARRFNVAENAPAVTNLEWLGLFSGETVPAGQKTVLDILSAQLLKHMQYDPGERDMIVLHHEFIADYPQKRTEKITSTLIAYGEPGGDSSMARTVSLPAAIAVKLILENRISLTGVQIPVTPEIYDPVLDELTDMGISFSEKTMTA
ncbi:saccharopine dehydrogenase NADP-binding domain-containing protein [bacterium]|nr:saccharopine dehydrogenase NADP-binding domain-containing protein [bacterium]